MIKTGKCPKCDKVPNRLIYQQMDASTVDMRTYRGAAFLCPDCRTILGAGFDPLYGADLVADAVIRKLEAGSKPRIQLR